MVKVWCEEVVYPSVLTLEFQSHLHLLFLKLGEQREKSERGVICDVGRKMN